MVVTESVITCPACGHARLEIMPQDVCQFFYECTGCGTLLRPKPGDCCVFCSFGSVACPPVQQGTADSGAGWFCEPNIADHGPIACTLAAGDLKARRDWIAQLAAQSLRSYRRHGSAGSNHAARS